MLSVGELKRQKLAKEDILILLPQSIIILITLLHARVNFCLPLYPLFIHLKSRGIVP